MNPWKLRSAIYISLVLIFGILACSDLVEDITTQNVGVKKTIIENESINGDKIELIIAQRVELTGPGIDKLQKTATENYFEVPINIPDIGMFLSILQRTEEVNLSCTLTNRVGNEVTFGIYFSDQDGIEDPWSDATFIASLTLPPNATNVEVNGVDDFDQEPAVILNSLINFVGTLVLAGKSQVVVYLTAKTPELNPDEEIDVLIQDMVLILPPFAHVKDVIIPGDLDNYKDKVKEVTDSKMVGSITNTGSATLFFSYFLSIVDGDFVTGQPGSEDSIAVGFIPPGTSMAFRNAPDFFVTGAEAKMNAGIQALSDGINIESNLFFWSDALIQAAIDSLILDSNIEVSL